MKSKKQKWQYGLAIMAMLVGGSSLSQAQTEDLTISSFDAGTQGTAPSGVGIWYGSSTATWDGTVDHTGNSGGSLYITCPDDASSDTPLNPYICMNGGNPWYNGGGHIDLTQYKSIEFDIKWDNTSALTVDQFNQPSTWPETYGPAGIFSGSDPGNGINIKAVCGGNGTFVQLVSTNIPSAASNGWVHMSIPIDPALAGIDNCNGIDLEKWINNHSSIVGAATVHFWIDDLTLVGTAGPPPPPTIKPLVKATQGLNVFNSTGGIYDRQEALLTQNTGVSWVGQATSEDPVSYSFTISGFPNDPSGSAEAYLFLSPNPASTESAPDWNETNCVVVYVQSNGSGVATMYFQYKINDANNNAMYNGGNNGSTYYTNAPGSWDGVTSPWFETGNLGSITNPTPFGTWTVKFTSDTNVTLIAPNGGSTNFVIPPYNISTLAPVGTPLYIYLGGQANNANGLNQAVVYSNFSVSGSATPFSDNFLADDALDTNLWSASLATGPNGILVVPSGAKYWLNWTLPANGFALQTSSNLANASAWKSPANNSLVSMNGSLWQLISTSDLPAGNAAFFRLIKRTFSQLQVLFPGETNAPDTETGKIGTPTPVIAGDVVNVTINAVDSNWHIINGASDTVDLTSDDTSSLLPNPASLVGGTLTQTVIFGASGNWTITATDVSNTNITSNTSSSITVN